MDIMDYMYIQTTKLEGAIEYEGSRLAHEQYMAKHFKTKPCCMRGKMYVWVKL